MPIKEFNVGDDIKILDTRLVNINSAVAGINCKIGCFVTIKPGVKIGNNVVIEDSTYISEKVIIGDNVTIGSGCTISSGVKIGDGVIIKQGSIITRDVDSWRVVFTQGKRYEQNISRKQRDKNGDTNKKTISRIS